ncbi:MAG: 3-oxoacyl-[acyl-carrier protein] reductase [uncultured Arthrobacter sp.]|uniref:3-oxoacyl-[acyl-carrier protein] reductase n=1 Tax=uncultured Arthrobacter sp. TaxID=114050 RepID=A0A6J4HZS1_9MICC|nr:SDR family oxidoreductase [uncultured Arthrobacter sp.]CAA9236338.1 MAG: 3-oxoacyl-[acyl-carrier protein] reductase [uncultured Arthrobacter sp.]
MTSTAMITGATAGLGAEFARSLAARGSNLVLVARDAERLEEVARRLRRAHGGTVEVLPADLLEDGGLDRVTARLAGDAVPITTLINNAGYGLRQAFAENSFEDERRHLRIHTEVPLALTHAVLGGMRQRGSGHIINVASVAGFVPRGTYGAAKAAMISFSRWANLAYGKEGITVTALCPGFVHTEFHDRMGLDKSTIPAWMWLNAEQVVAEGLRDAAAGKAVSIPSVKYKALAGIARALPSRLVAGLASRGR